MIRMQSTVRAHTCTRYARPALSGCWVLEVLKRVVNSTGTWLETIGPRIDFELFVKSAVSRRAWITTLQELRTWESNERRERVVALWTKLGDAHGFREDIESAWLTTGDNAKPVRRNGLASSRCGWSGCFCHEQRPLYRLSACSGCDSVFYCDKECQKR